MRRSWPAIRAFIITAVMALGMIEGTPVRVRSTEAAGSYGRAQLVRGLATTRETVLRPFQFIGSGLRVTQRWKLFPMANRDRYRMWIEARRGPSDSWTLLYRPHDRNHAWLAPELEYRRIRGAWNPGTGRTRGAYPHFVSWVARTTFERAPQLNELRVRMERIDIDPRTGQRHGTGAFLWDEMRSRAEVLP